MKNFWKNHPFLITIAGSFIFIGLIFYLLLIPLVKRAFVQSDEIQKEIINDGIYKSGVGKISRMEKEYNDFLEKEYAMKVALSSDNEVGFIKKLESLAQETNNQIELEAGSVHYREGDPRADTKGKAALAKKKEEDKTVEEKLSYGQYFSMQINLTGDYTGLVNFINKLESSNYYINVVSLSIKKMKESELKNSLALNADKKNNPEAKEKEVISSLINAIIYTKD